MGSFASPPCGERRNGAARHNRGHLAADEVGGERRETFVVILGPAILDPEVAALDIAGFGEAPVKSDKDFAFGSNIELFRKPITGMA